MSTLESRGEDLYRSCPGPDVGVRVQTLPVCTESGARLRTVPVTREQQDPSQDVGFEGGSFTTRLIPLWSLTVFLLECPEPLGVQSANVSLPERPSTQVPGHGSTPTLYKGRSDRRDLGARRGAQTTEDSHFLIPPLPTVPCPGDDVGIVEPQELGRSWCDRRLRQTDVGGGEDVDVVAPRHPTCPRHVVVS